MSASIEVELQIACRAHDVPPSAEIRSWIEDAVRHADAVPDGRYEVVVRVVDERESRALNYRFRGKDRPTNVLAFPAGDPALLQPPAAGESAPPSLPLGDLAICAPVLAREAAEQGKPAAAHWAHLVVHGTLHLLGYDHASRDEAERMEGLERRILAARGIADPYAERHPGAPANAARPDA
ncbi:MAG TPA: rRNA maturation RNase YbeY [Woeseiaceae bacterium]|nr:rRNA maturation RNase YbeY [Woeseiaceae bacterium]